MPFAENGKCIEYFSCAANNYNTSRQEKNLINLELCPADGKVLTDDNPCLFGYNYSTTPPPPSLSLS